MVIIVRTIHIGGHSTDKIATILATICLAHFNSSNFSQSIPLVACFQGATQKIFLFDRLLREFWINTRTAEEKKFFYAGFTRVMNQVILYLQVFINKLRGIQVISTDSTHFSRGIKNVFRLYLRKKLTHGLCIQ